MAKRHACSWTIPIDVSIIQCILFLKSNLVNFDQDYRKIYQHLGYQIHTIRVTMKYIFTWCIFGFLGIYFYIELRGAWTALATGGGGPAVLGRGGVGASG